MTRISIYLYEQNTYYRILYGIRRIQYHLVYTIWWSVYNECNHEMKPQDIYENRWHVFPITVWIYGNTIGLPVNTFPGIVIILLLLTFIRFKTVRLTWVFILQVEISSKQSIEIFYQSFIDSSRVGRARE